MRTGNTPGPIIMHALAEHVLHPSSVALRCTVGTNTIICYDLSATPLASYAYPERLRPALREYVRAYVCLCLQKDERAGEDTSVPPCDYFVLVSTPGKPGVTPIIMWLFTFCNRWNIHGDDNLTFWSNKMLHILLEVFGSLDIITSEKGAPSFSEKEFSLEKNGSECNYYIMKVLLK